MNASLLPEFKVSGGWDEREEEMEEEKEERGRKRTVKRRREGEDAEMGHMRGKESCKDSLCVVVGRRVRHATDVCWGEVRVRNVEERRRVMEKKHMTG